MSNSVYNHTSDKQNRTTTQRESDLIIMSLITDRIGRHNILLQIVHNHYKLQRCRKRLFVLICVDNSKAWVPFLKGG